MKVVELPIDQIMVEDRARKDLGNIDELADSINKLGLLNPITIDEDYKLIAGERRYRACQKLGWRTIPCRFIYDLSPQERLELELEENVRRKNFTWQEEVKLKERIVEHSKEIDPNLTLEQIANEIIKDGKSVSLLKKHLFLAKALKEFPELEKEKDASNAYRKARRLMEKRKREELLEVASIEITVSGKVYERNGVKLIHNDCVVGLKEIPTSSVDLILTDYPFGVDLDKNYDFNKSWDTVYSDSEKYLLEELLPKTAKELGRVLKDGHHAFIFFPSKFYTEFRRELSKHLNIDPIPLIWHKIVGGTTFSPYTRFMPNYEPIFHCWKGNKPIAMKSPGYSVLSYKNKSSGKLHPAEKPIELMQFLIEQATIEGELVLDIFSGSCSTGIACLQSNRKAILFEREESWFNLGVERLMKADDEKED